MPFVTGKSGNPGGRPSPARQELADLLDVTFPVTKRKKVIRKLVEDAEQGDHAARTLLLAYTYGKPKEALDVSIEDMSGFTVEQLREIVDS